MTWAWRAVRSGTFAILLLESLIFSTAIGTLGCSSKSAPSVGEQPTTGSQTESLTGPVTITLSAPNPMTALAPVLEAANSVALGSNANVVSGTTVAMGAGGVPDVEPGALLNDVWSRGPVQLRDRVTIRGTLHAANLTQGNGDSIAARDTTPRLDPPSTLSWTVTYPPGTGTNVTLGVGQSQTLVPGLYGSIVLNSGSSLTLKTGTYFLTDFVFNSSVTVNLDQANGPVIVYVANTLNLRGAFVPLGGSDGGVVHPDLAIIYVGNNQIFVESLFDGALVVPFSTLTLRQVSGIHTGFFAGKDINNLDSTVKVQYRFPAALVAAANPPGPTCQSLLAGFVPPPLIRHYCRRCVSPDDSDYDGVPDCVDGCPDDKAKTAPGICGCNVSDKDTDGDGTPDCKDLCPRDPNNVVPGQCGCVGQVGLQPAGIACTDTACPQPGATCNGAGICGNPSACSPCAGGRLIRSFGVSYWFCGMTFPPEVGPDGGTEVVTTGSPTSESSAQSACSAKGLTLTRINAPDENRFIAQYLTAPLWLGANDLQTSGQWRWSVPNSNNGDLFWSGGPTGSRQNNLYSNWGAGAPSSATCASMVPEGHWFDTNCSEQLGWVCAYHSPPPGLPANAGIHLPGPSNPVPFPDAGCVNEFDLDAGGLPDSLADLINEVDAAHHGIFGGIAAHPPPDGSTSCPSDPFYNPVAASSEALGLVADSGAGCAFVNAQQIFSPNGSGDGGPGLVDCVSDDECADAGLGAGFVCREVKDVPTCTPPDAGTGATILDAGSCPGHHAFCGQMVCRQFPKTCREFRICKPNTDFDAGPDPTTNLDAGAFDPSLMFDGAPPDASPSAEYSDPAMFDGAAHTWCHMDLQNPVASANQPPQSTNGSSGTGSPITFTFDPNLVFNVNANPLALGENDMDIHAAATLTAAVHLKGFLGQTYDADVVDVGAGVHAKRCTVNNDETTFTVLGVDILPLLGLGVPKFNSADLFPTETKTCNDAVGNFSLWANRAKKAFRDAQQLLIAYNNIKSNGSQLASTLCQDIMAGVSENDVAFFPGGLDCPDNEPVEITINRFVDFLQAPGFGQISQLKHAVTDMVNKSTHLLDGIIPNMNVRFLDLERDESQTILNVPFAIGPVPMVLQVDVFAGYGINGQFKLELKTPIAQMGGLGDTSHAVSPGAQNVSPIELAHVEVDVIPWAAAGLSAFVGAGVDLGAFSATIGIEGRVTLGQVSAPIFAGAGLDLLEQFDPRPIPKEIGLVSVTDSVLGPAFHFSAPKSFNFMVWFDYGAGIQLSNVLSGEINARLEIDLFFFSAVWRERIVKFNGWSKFFNLTSGSFGASTATNPQPPSLGTGHLPAPQGNTTVVTSSATGGPSLGLAEAQLPLTVLQSLPLPAGDAGTDGGDGGTPQSVSFDASALQNFFYDNQCCAHANETCKPSGAGVPQCCPDFQCTLPAPDASTGSCTPICVNQGGRCKPTSQVGCCGSLFCDPGNTCQSCIAGVRQACTPSEPCCSNMTCTSSTGSGTCCLNDNQPCTTPAQCCNGNCTAGFCVKPPQ